jgi:hypothetical protein
MPFESFRSMKSPNFKLRSLTLIAISAMLVGLVACGNRPTPACYLSHHPSDTKSPALRHFPVARQGKLTAWLTSAHRAKSGDWLYAPNDPSIRHRIVGIIPASAMPTRPAHDGAFLLTSTYTGPIFPLWEGKEAKGLLYTGHEGGWTPVGLYQADVINTWVNMPGSLTIGGWSGYPVVIGSPANPEFVAGAMWYRANDDGTWGGAASTRMLKQWIPRLKFADYVTVKEP